ncbi:MAG: putative Ig domain-containing protein [bacterium]
MRNYFSIWALVMALIFGLFGFAQAIDRIDLSQVHASFVGENGDDRLGVSVSLAADINGDGYNDVFISAVRNDYGGSNAGQIYLILGKSSGWAMRTDMSTADASFIGENAGDYVGDVYNAGDVNGDGYDDFLIGNPIDSYGGHWAGQTYLILGKPSGWEMHMNLSEADASFVGEEEYDMSGGYGTGVSGAGDVNGDGYDDILIGAYGNPYGGNLAGQTYLIFGKPDGWQMRMDLSEADASFVGENGWDFSGSGVSIAGDVNGDGYDDILIGAPVNGYGAGDAGQTYLILGKSDGWAMRTPLSAADASFVGENEGDISGHTVAGAGDVNGDGYNDILICANWSSAGADTAGQVYLILGKPSGWAMRTSLSEADVSFIGEKEGDRAGFRASGAGDVNGDGYDDILIVAIWNDEGGSRAGQVYLILGKPSGWAMRTPLWEADVSFIGEEAYDQAGWSISGGGDFNGDGYDDILIGAADNDFGGEDAGQAYLSLLYIPLTITTDTLPDGAVGIAYSETLSATGGAPPYTWSLYSGSLPEGLSLDSPGLISGVPTLVDTADFTVQVTDSASATHRKDFSIIIRESVKGDVNGDGQINVLDVVFAVNIILESYDPTPTQYWAADCNGDETVNVLDLVGIVNVILGIGTCPP